MFNPKFAIYHPNAKVTGSAMMLSLHPLIDNEDKHEDGYVEMTIVPQKTAGIGGKYPTYDVDNSITAHLCYDDVCHILQVLRGETEQIRDGHGLCHSDVFASCKVNVKHFIDPYHCYKITMTHTVKSNGDVQTNTFALTPAESCGLCEALSMACFYIVFGNPKSYTNN